MLHSSDINCDGHSDLILKINLLETLTRVRKSKNFPDSKIFIAKTFRIKCVNCDIDNFATNARKPKIFHKMLAKLLKYSLKHKNSRVR